MTSLFQSSTYRCFSLEDAGTCTLHLDSQFPRCSERNFMLRRGWSRQVNAQGRSRPVAAVHATQGIKSWGSWRTWSKRGWSGRQGSRRFTISGPTTTTFCSSGDVRRRGKRVHSLPNHKQQPMASLSPRILSPSCAWTVKFTSECFFPSYVCDFLPVSTRDPYSRSEGKSLFRAQKGESNCVDPADIALCYFTSGDHCHGFMNMVPRSAKSGHRFRTTETRRLPLTTTYPRKYRLWGGTRVIT